MSIHPVMQRLAEKLQRTDLPDFVPGDTVRVQVKIKEGDDAEDIFVKLMGDIVEPRREFIQENALSVANLDV